MKKVSSKKAIITLKKVKKLIRKESENLVLEREEIIKELSSINKTLTETKKESKKKLKKIWMSLGIESVLKLLKDTTFFSSKDSVLEDIVKLLLYTDPETSKDNTISSPYSLLKVSTQINLKKHILKGLKNNEEEVLSLLWEDAFKYQAILNKLSSDHFKTISKSKIFLSKVDSLNNRIRQLNKLISHSNNLPSFVKKGDLLDIYEKCSSKFKDQLILSIKNNSPIKKDKILRVEAKKNKIDLETLKQMKKKLGNRFFVESNGYVSNNITKLKLFMKQKGLNKITMKNYADLSGSSKVDKKEWIGSYYFAYIPKSKSNKPKGCTPSFQLSYINNIKDKFQDNQDLNITSMFHMYVPHRLKFSLFNEAINKPIHLIGIVLDNKKITFFNADYISILMNESKWNKFEIVSFKNRLDLYLIVCYNTKNNQGDLFSKKEVISNISGYVFSQSLIK